MIPVLTNPLPHLPAMQDDALEKVRRLEAELSVKPQVAIHTSHLIHGGLYARTIRIPAGVVLTGAYIKLPTVLIINGDVTVFTGGKTLELCGYHVIAARAGRKQVFLAHADTDVTMAFASDAKTVEEAEAQFTDEVHLLLSRRCAGQDSVIITEV